jgi:hypothetical protein
MYAGSSTLRLQRRQAQLAAWKPWLTGCGSGAGMSPAPSCVVLQNGCNERPSFDLTTSSYDGGIELPVLLSRHNVFEKILVLRCEAFCKLENLKAVAIADGPELDIG